MRKFLYSLSASVFILFACFFSSTQTAHADIGRFDLTVKSIEGRSATFEFTVSGDENDDIQPGYTLRLFPETGTPVGAFPGFSHNIDLTPDGVPEDALTFSKSLTVSDLEEGMIYFAAVQKKEVSAFFSTFVRFTAGTEGVQSFPGLESSSDTLSSVVGFQKEARERKLLSFRIGGQFEGTTFSGIIGINIDPKYQNFQRGDVYYVYASTEELGDRDSLDSIPSGSYIQGLTVEGNKLEHSIPFSFDELRSGQTYYVVGIRVANDSGDIVETTTQTANITVPNIGEEGQVNLQENTLNQQPRDLPECSYISDGWRGRLGCISNAINLFVTVTSWVSVTSAEFLDVLLDFSISSETYRNSTFITQGWGLLRDFANIIFIFILAFAGLSTVLGLPGFNTKKTITWVIVVALFINFSLFLTNVVVDMGNITARVFYNAVEVTDERTADGGDNFSTDSGISRKSLSVAVAQQMRPQQFFSEDIFDSSTDIGYFIFMQIIIVGVNILIAYIFLSIAMLFVGRVVGLMIVMITSPIAFISVVLPSSVTKNLKGFGWGSWLGNLVSLSFMAPVFLFFLYIILTYINVQENLLDTIGTSNTNAAGKLVTLFIPIAIIAVLLLKAKNLTKDLSGEIGAKINGIAGTALGLGVGVATGGAALLARGTLGAGASALAKGGVGETLRDMKATGGFFERKLGSFGLKTIESGSKGSYDLRKTAVGNTIAKETGLKFDQRPLNTLGLSTKNTQGGFEGQKERIESEKLKEAESLKSKLSDDAILATYGTEEEKRRGALLSGKEKAKHIADIRNRANEQRIKGYGKRLENEARLSNLSPLRPVNLASTILTGGFIDSARTQAELAAAKKIEENALYLSGGKINKEKKTKAKKAEDLRKEVDNYAKEYFKAFGKKHEDMDALIVFGQKQKSDELADIRKDILTTKAILENENKKEKKQLSKEQVKELERTRQELEIKEESIKRKMDRLKNLDRDIVKAEAELAKTDEGKKGDEKKEKENTEKKEGDEKE